MTKDQLQQELKEKVKAGIKPSDIKRLKRSKSESDLVPTPPSNSELIALQRENKELKKQIRVFEKELAEKETFVLAPEENPAELKQKITELEDQILELRLSKIKEFSEYRAKLTDLASDLSQQTQTDSQAIRQLEQRVQSLTSQRTRLQGEKSLAEWKLSKLELGESTNPHQFWTDYGLIISLVVVTWLAVWLLSNNNLV